MDALQALLSADLDIKKKVRIDRLGIDLEIRALSTQEFKQITEQATFGETLDEFKMGSVAIANACVNLNFGDTQLLKKYGVASADECVQKALLAGEVALLQQEVMNVSGFKDINAQVKEAKN